MSKSFRLAKLCFGLILIVILFSISRQLIVSAHVSKVVESNIVECGKFGIRNSRFFRISRSASTVLTADFNNDGIPDIAAPMPDTNSIAVALGNNETGFGTVREFIGGVSPQDAITGDFNRDGETDLAVTSKSDEQLNILLGDGKGNFDLTASYPVGNAPDEVETADLNNDGWLDIVVANIESYNFSVFLGGANGFVSADSVVIPFSARPYSFALADFDRDGKVDLITSTSSSVRLFSGNGQGNFTNSLSFETGESYELASADFNNDNYADFAVFAGGKVLVYINDRNRGFNQPVNKEVPYGGGVVAGDLNNDGKIDLISGGFVLLNDGNANFTLRENSNAFGSAIADFNGDGTVDIASAGGVSDFYGSEPYTTFRVSYGMGDVQFESPTYLPPLGGSTGVVTGDFNNDGRYDIATSQPYSNQVRVSLQKADGSFTLSSVPVFSGGGSSSAYNMLATGDFNNDGNTDLVTTVWWARSVNILTSNGSGQFTTSFINLNLQYTFYPQFLQTGDFNNDGKTDIVLIGDYSYIVVTNNGNGAFSNSGLISISNQNASKRAAVADFNADGKLDLAIMTNSGLWILRGNGDGTFAGAGTFTVPAYASMIRSADLNADGRPDLVVTTGSSWMGGNPGLYVLVADANGGFTQTSYSISGGPNDVTIEDFDGDGKKDLLLINSPNSGVTLFVGNGSGVFTPQTPILALDNIYAAAAADFNQDQKLDLVLVSNFGPTAVFYNETPKAPCLTVNDVEITEGNNGITNAQFTVALSAPATQAVTVDYRIVGRNARDGSDFNSLAGRVEFSPGTQSQTVNVQVIGDVIDEADETFQVVLSKPANASLVDAIGIGTIKDDDALPSVSIADVSIIEGSGGNATQITFSASLSSPTGRKAKVEFKTVNGTAAAGDDFSAAAGTIVFNAGETLKQITVAVNPDVFVEPDETFKIKLANPDNLIIADDEAVASIVNDDLGGSVQFETAVVETGETNETVIVNVRRTGGNAGGILVAYSTSDGTARANRDYLPSSGKIVFGANETVKSFIVPILNDAIDENPLETINLTLENISGGANLGSQSNATLNIADDDPAATMTVNPAGVNEGNTGTEVLNFDVRLLTVSEQIVNVNFATADGTAKASEDYQTASGVLTFAPGETSKVISVLVLSDENVEPGETFFLNLSNPVNGVLQSAQAVGTIVNDDFNGRRANGDFDGDGKTDIAVFRPDGGNWFYLQSGDGGFRAAQFGSSEDRIAPGDYDGDGKTDYAVFRPSNGVWYILQSRDGFTAAQFGLAEDLPVQGDYDGDGKTDIAVFRPSNGVWYLLQSTAGFAAAQFGSSGDKPVQADYDGDEKTDLSVFRPSNGTWYRFNSSSNQFVTLQFGGSGDKPVAADYDGDGRDDIAVFRPENGVWYLLQSTDGFRYTEWGVATDQLIPGDYDGDGKADIAVFRRENSNWFQLLSSGGQQTLAFGVSSDLPVPSGYLPK